MTIARMVGGWLALVVGLSLLASAGARGEEADGRRLEVTAATLAASIDGHAAPPGFRYLRLEFAFANTGTAPVVGAMLGHQAWVLEDGLFPYYAEERVGPVDQSALFQPVTLTAQDGIEGELVVLVPARPGALALVYEADGVRLELPLAPDEAAAEAVTTPEPADTEEAAPADELAAAEEAVEVEEQPVAEEPTPAVDEAAADTEAVEETPPAAPTVATDRAGYAPGETIVVSVAGLPGNQQDWLTLVAVGAPEDTFGEWTFTEGVTEGEFR